MEEVLRTWRFLVPLLALWCHSLGIWLLMMSLIWTLWSPRCICKVSCLFSNPGWKHMTHKRRATLARRSIDGKRTREAGTAAIIAHREDLQQCFQSSQTEFLRKSEKRRHDEYSSHDRFGFVPEWNPSRCHSQSVRASPSSWMKSSKLSCPSSLLTDFTS